MSAGDYIVQVTDTAGVLSDYALTNDNNPLLVHLEEEEVHSDSGADFGYVAVAHPTTGSVTNNPSAGNPDFEFKIEHFSSLGSATPKRMLDFDFAGSSASGLWLGLAGLTVLAAGTLFWLKRRAG